VGRFFLLKAGKGYDASAPKPDEVIVQESQFSPAFLN
jgi:hypothetical protein